MLGSTKRPIIHAAGAKWAQTQKWAKNAKTFQEEKLEAKMATQGQGGDAVMQCIYQLLAKIRFSLDWKVERGERREDQITQAYVFAAILDVKAILGL